ncbi:MAG: substrate binding domain-containing protein, partial [Myxococcota bacterium]
VELSNRIVDLEAEGFDAVLRVSRTQLSGSGLRARRLGTIHVGVYAAPCYVARHGAPQSFDDLRNHALVGLPEVVAEDARAEFVAAGDMMLATELATAGVGIALLPTFIAASHVDSEALVRLLDEHPVVTAGLYLVFPNTARQPPKLAAFRDEVLRFIEAHPLA